MPVGRQRVGATDRARTPLRQSFEAFLEHHTRLKSSGRHDAHHPRAPTTKGSGKDYVIPCVGEDAAVNPTGGSRSRIPPTGIHNNEDSLSLDNPES